MLPTDLPETMPEFLARFGTDVACRDHLFTLRWPDGFHCDCGHTEYYLLASRTNVYECSICGTQHSLLAGTIFEQTKTGLSKWFLAIYLFAGSKGGISALELKRHLGFGSDQTAWTWLHKIRRAMSVRGAALASLVEVDETFLGGPKPGKRGRGAEGKTLVAGAVETRTYEVEAPDPAPLRGIARTLAERVAERLAKGGVATRFCLGRIRLGVIEGATTKALEEFIKTSIEPSASIATDGWTAYLHLARGGYQHERIIISKSDGEAHEHLPASHLVFTMLKRVLVGTYHGGISVLHTPAYLDEVVFRFNRRSMKPARIAQRLIERAMETLPICNKTILGHA